MYILYRVYRTLIGSLFYKFFTNNLQKIKMMMKERHAYLILAHTDFMVLKELVGVLDDYRNDIYIHFDRKVIDPPILEAKYSKLLMLEDRVDVRWGIFRCYMQSIIYLKQHTKQIIIPIFILYLVIIFLFLIRITYMIFLRGVKKYFNENGNK